MEMAHTLAVAETTVKIHVQHILRKLKLSSRVQAAVFAAFGPQRWQTQAASGEPSA